MRDEAELQADYTASLREYLSNGGEASLARAAAVGREAMAQSLGVLDIVMMHHQSLGELLDSFGDEPHRSAWLEAASAVLREALSTFEITHQGFREAADRTARMLQFSAVVCHELRTPLTSVLNSAGMLQELVRDETPEGRLIANVMSSAKILDARTGDFMDLVALQSGALTLKLQRIDVGPLLAEFVQRAEVDVHNLNMELRADIAGDLPLVSADPDRLIQVISNLVQNAGKYGAEGRFIDLQAYAGESRLVIVVQDYGPGIRLWDRMKLFQNDVRVTARKGEVPGLGLGLALCKQLVELHDGTITLDSAAGQGSVFRIELPLAGAQSTME